MDSTEQRNGELRRSTLADSWWSGCASSAGTGSGADGGRCAHAYGREELAVSAAAAARAG
jgi:hypothetical protein